MPRALGQVDSRKAEAILEAASAVLAERGPSASVEEVARRAGVSKQTVYNHYGCKTELVRTLVDRRRSLLTATFAAAPPDRPLTDVLTDYARAVMETITSPASIQLTRMAVAAVADMPELSRAIRAAGSEAAARDLARFLANRPELELEEPERAAEVFMGMALGRLHTRLLMGADVPDAATVARRAREAAERFIRAYGKA